MYMQKEFNKLSIEKQRKFIVKNFLKDEHFKKFHKKVKNIFVEEIYPKNQQKALIDTRNCKINDKINKILQKYKDNILDLYHYPINTYFFNNALLQKTKLENIIDSKNLIYKDENDFRVFELILDTWRDCKKIINNQELSLEPIIKVIQSIFILDDITKL